MSEADRGGRPFESRSCSSSSSCGTRVLVNVKGNLYGRTVIAVIEFGKISSSPNGQAVQVSERERERVRRALGKDRRVCIHTCVYQDTNPRGKRGFYRGFPFTIATLLGC